MDIVDHVTRSRMMSGIRAKNTKPEVLVRGLLHRRGFRFRIHVSGLPGTPDVVLPKYKSVLFIHGCFWHGHECHIFKWPSTRPEFWRSKIERNRENYLKNTASLISTGWRVAVIWECAIRAAKKDYEFFGQSLEDWLNSNTEFLEMRG